MNYFCLYGKPVASTETTPEKQTSGHANMAMQLKLKGQGEEGSGVGMIPAIAVKKGKAGGNSGNDDVKVSAKDLKALIEVKKSQSEEAKVIKVSEFPNAAKMRKWNLEFREKIAASSGRPENVRKGAHLRSVPRGHNTRRQFCLSNSVSRLVRKLRLRIPTCKFIIF